MMSGARDYCLRAVFLAFDLDFAAGAVGGSGVTTPKRISSLLCSAGDRVRSSFGTGQSWLRAE